MHKRIVASYVKDELKEGKTIENIREELLKDGYDKADVGGVLRTFEYREADLRNKENKVKIQRTTASIWLMIALIIIVVNSAFFIYYFNSPDYVLVRETPTGLVTQSITEEELRDLKEGVNISESSAQGLGAIS